MASKVSSDYTTELSTTQAPESYQDRYAIISQLGTQLADMQARAADAKTRQGRDGWLQNADTVWANMEAQAVFLFDLNDTERADFNAMIGFKAGLDPATAIEHIMEARDSRDYNSTIKAVLWGGY